MVQIQQDKLKKYYMIWIAGKEREFDKLQQKIDNKIREKDLKD